MSQIFRRNKYGICAGRWQPWHYGHKWFFEQTLDEYKSVVLAIINPDPTRYSTTPEEFKSFLPILNPMNYWLRYRMLWDHVRSVGLLERTDFAPAWHPMQSLEREAYYLPPRLQREWPIVEIDEDAYDKQRKLCCLKETVELLPMSEAPSGYRATLVRQLMKIDDTRWERQVPRSIGVWLKRFGIPERVRTSNARPAIDPDHYDVYVSDFQPFDIYDEQCLLALINMDGRNRYSVPLVIGVVCEINPYKASPLDFNYWERVCHIKAFLLHHNWLDRVMIVPLVPGITSAFLPDNYTLHLRGDCHFNARHELGIQQSQVQFWNSFPPLSLDVRDDWEDDFAIRDELLPECLRNVINSDLRLRMPHTLPARIHAGNNVITVGAAWLDVHSLLSEDTVVRAEAITALAQCIKSTDVGCPSLFDAPDLFDEDAYVGSVIIRLDKACMNMPWYPEFRNILRENPKVASLLCEELQRHL